MPTSSKPKDPAPDQPVEADTNPSPDPEAAPEAGATAPAPGLEPGVYEYAHPSDCVYPVVPLTARAANPGRAADGDDPGEPAVAPTVFDWPFGAPDDGRWTKTRKKPTQRADNEPPLSSEE